jgi:hypothetical protein
MRKIKIPDSNSKMFWFNTFLQYHNRSAVRDHGTLQPLARRA